MSVIALRRKQKQSIRNAPGNFRRVMTMIGLEEILSRKKESVKM